MKLLEYEAKLLLQKYGAYGTAQQLIHKPLAETTLGFPVVIKAQIPKGGRGKAGGVQAAHNSQELSRITRALFAKPLLGLEVKTLLIEPLLAIKRELYLAITFDRHKQELVLLAHKSGGVDIEEASQAEKPLRMLLTQQPTNTTIQKVNEYFQLSSSTASHLSTLIKNLWQLCIQEDATLVEINPLVIAPDDALHCADAKIELDDMAAFRHSWRFEAKPASTQFVILNKQGTVASMANGAGLAMATIDAIKAAGGEPANFFDVGGGTNVAGMVAAFEKMAALPDVKAIVVNIFGGITRCDEVAEAIITATKTVKNLPKLFIRLTGTNEAEGQALLHKTGIATLPTLAACVEAAAEEVNRV